MYARNTFFISGKHINVLIKNKLSSSNFMPDKKY